MRVRRSRAVLARPAERERAFPAPAPAFASLREEAAALEQRLAAIRQQQRQELVAAISLLIGPGVVFSARELFAHRVVSPELAAALDDAGITSVRKLGKRLRQLCGACSALERIGLDHNAALWMVR